MHIEHICLIFVDAFSKLGHRLNDFEKNMRCFSLDCIEENFMTTTMKAEKKKIHCATDVRQALIELNAFAVAH